MRSKYLSYIQHVHSLFIVNFIAILIVSGLAGNNDTLADTLSTHQVAGQANSRNYIQNPAFLSSLVFTDTTKNEKNIDQKNSDDELQRAINEKNQMKNENYLSDDMDFSRFIQNLEDAFADVEMPDSSDWNRAHQNLKEAMDNLKSESRDFKKDLSKAKVELNKAIKRMQKQLQEFNEDDLKEMKKELQKAIDEMKNPVEPEKPQLHKLDTIKL